ncbi:MAG: hypothetical protein EZS28_053434, partial [Streblomastix strix]
PTLGAKKAFHLKDCTPSNTDNSAATTTSPFFCHIAALSSNTTIGVFPPKIVVLLPTICNLNLRVRFNTSLRARPTAALSDWLYDSQLVFGIGRLYTNGVCVLIIDCGTVNYYDDEDDDEDDEVTFEFYQQGAMGQYQLVCNTPVIFGYADCVIEAGGGKQLYYQLNQLEEEEEEEDY